MIQIETLWHKDIKKISQMINKLHEMHDKPGVGKEISNLLDYFKRDLPKKKKEEKKLYFLQWSAQQALIKIGKNNPEYLIYDHKKDLIWLSRNPNTNINERARELIDLLNLGIKNEKILYLQLKDFQDIIKKENKLEISRISELLEIDFQDALDWIKQLLEEKYITGYISSDIIHIND